MLSWIRISVIGLGLLLASLSWADAREARALVEQYYGALITGDTVAMLRLLSAREAARHQHATEPGYGAQLVLRYQNATLEILDIINSNEKYVVNISLHLDDKETIKETLVIRRVVSKDHLPYEIHKVISG